MEQKRELSIDEKERIKTLAHCAFSASRFKWNHAESFCSGHSSGYTACAERSVPLSAFLELREALQFALDTLPNDGSVLYKPEAAMRLNNAVALLTATEKYKPLS